MAYVPNSSFENHELQAALGSAVVGVAYWDRGLFNRMSSPSFLTLMALTHLPIQGKHLHEVLGGLFYDTHKPYIEGVLRGELHSTDSMSVRSPQGDIKRLRFTYIPAFENSELCGFYLELADLSILAIVDRVIKKYQLQRKGLYQLPSHGIALTDHEGKLIDFNMAFCKLFGFDSDPRTFMDCWNAVSSEYFQREIKKLGAPNSEGRWGPIESEFIRDDFMLVLIKITGQTTVVEGDKHYIWWSVEDISESKEVDAQLKANSEVFKAITDGVLITDEKGVLISVNPAFSTITGYATEEMIGKTCAFLQGCDTDLNTVEKIRISRQTGSDFSGEILNYRKDGSFFWNELTIAPVRNDQGHVFRYVGIARDITERRKAEESLEVAAVAFESREGIMITDANQRILRVNRAFTEITGYSASDVEGRTPRLLSSGRQDESFYEKLSATLQSECSWQGEIWNRKKTGEEYLEQLIITAVKDSSGKVTHYVGAFIDITTKRAMEESLKSNEMKLTEAQRIGQMGSWELDHALNSLVWSDEIMRIFEIESTENVTTYENFLSHVHPADRTLVDEAYRDSLVKRTPYNIDHRILLQNGSVKYVRERCETTYDCQGYPLLSIGTAQDITERKLAEIELNIAAVAFESQQAIIISDASQKVLRVNHAFSEITGYSAKEVIGHSLSHLSGALGNDDFFTEASSICMLKQSAWEGEVFNRHKNGYEYPVFLTISAVRNSENMITHHVMTFTDITDRKRTEEKIHQLAFFDPLTKLPNRQFLFDRLQQALMASTTSQHYGALLLVDLDFFMTLNDTLGHDVGDQLLFEVATNLVETLSSNGLVARLGNDEFVVLLEQLGTVLQDAVDQAADIGNQLLAILDRTYQLSNNSYVGTASIGITLFSGHEEDSFDELLKQIDLALRHAKASGRNALSFYAPQMQARVSERAELEADLRVAIRLEQFVLHYQPQIDSVGNLIGAEALVRWQCPKRGTVSPDQFISILEETGLILSLGNWIIQTACEQLAHWSGQPQLEALTISVNMSARQIHQPDFVSQVLYAINRTGANPRRLELELTESLLLNDVEDTIEKMTALRNRGLTFALDDFGTGYSSLSILKRLPIDRLKIDRSFVMEIPTDQSASTIVRAIVGLGNSLGLMMVAEGVETIQQLKFLNEYGCHAYQGYLFARPLDKDEFRLFVNRTVT